jgi:cytoskeleton protein RodZ
VSELDQEQRDLASESAGGVSIGAALRSTREARGDSLSDVAHALKLSPGQIEALEMERFDLLPGPVFVRGFLRNYARYLGLDPETVTAAFVSEAPVQSVRLSPVGNAVGAMPNGNGERKVLKPALVVVCGMSLALLAGWYFDWFKVPGTAPVAVEDRVGSAPIMSPPVAVLPQDPVPVTPQSSPAPAEVEPLPVPLMPDGEPSSAVAEASAEEPATAPASPTPAPAVPEDVSAAGEAPPAVSEVQAEEPVLDPAVGQLVFRMEGESWIQVRDGAGVIVFTGTGTSGTSRTVQGKRPFSIVVGNAASVSLEHDGVPFDLAPHTRSGGVARVTID